MSSQKRKKLPLRKNYNPEKDRLSTPTPKHLSPQSSFCTSDSEEQSGRVNGKRTQQLAPEMLDEKIKQIKNSKESPDAREAEGDQPRFLNQDEIKFHHDMTDPNYEFRPLFPLNAKCNDNTIGPRASFREKIKSTQIGKLHLK
jgi:hypothetical protein